MEAKLLLIPWLVSVSYSIIPLLRIAINPPEPILKKLLSGDRTRCSGESPFVGERP